MAPFSVCSHFTICICMSFILSYSLVIRTNYFYHSSVYQLHEDRKGYLNRILYGSPHYDPFESDPQLVANINCEILDMRNATTKSLIDELEYKYGLSTKAVKERWDLERILAKQRLLNRMRMDSKANNDKQSKKRQALALEGVLESISPLERSLVLNEIQRRGIPCNPLGERADLDVLLAKHILHTGRQVQTEDCTMSVLGAELIEDTLNYSRVVGTSLVKNETRDAIRRGAYSLAAFSEKLSSTSAEREAERLIREGRSHDAVRNLDWDDELLDSYEVELRQLGSFDAVVAWAKRTKSVSLIVALLESRGAILDSGIVETYSLSELAAILADAVMIEKKKNDDDNDNEKKRTMTKKKEKNDDVCHISDPFSSDRNQLRGSINISSHRPNRITKKISTGTGKRTHSRVVRDMEPLENFSIEADLLKSLLRKTRQVATRALVYSENLFADGVVGAFRWAQHPHDLHALPVFKLGAVRLVLGCIALLNSLVVKALYHAAVWTGADLLPPSHTLLLAAGYAIVSRRGLWGGFGCGLLAIKMVSTVFGSSSTSTRAAGSYSTAGNAFSASTSRLSRSPQSTPAAVAMGTTKTEYKNRSRIQNQEIVSAALDTSDSSSALSAETSTVVVDDCGPRAVDSGGNDSNNITSTGTLL